MLIECQSLSRNEYNFWVSRITILEDTTIEELQKLVAFNASESAIAWSLNMLLATDAINYIKDEAELAAYLNRIGFCYETHGWDEVFNGIYCKYDQKTKEHIEDHVAKVVDRSTYQGDFYYRREITVNDIPTLRELYK